MDITIQSQMPYGDAAALEDWFLAHRFEHEQTSAALGSKFGATISTAAIGSGAAARAWVEVMRGGPTSKELSDWLSLHWNLHQSEFDAMGFGQAPDLREVNFGSKAESDDWHYAHAAIHAAVQQNLGLS